MAVIKREKPVVLTGKAASEFLKMKAKNEVTAKNRVEAYKKISSQIDKQKSRDFDNND